MLRGKIYRVVKVLEIILVKNSPDPVVFLMVVLNLAYNFANKIQSRYSLSFNRDFYVETICRF